MHQFSLAALKEKNKISNTAPFLLLVKIEVAPDIIIRLVNNNEDIVWRGEEWQRFPIKPGDVPEDSKAIQQVQLSVSNVDGLVQAYLEEYDGFTDKEITLYIVHAAHLDQPEAEIEETFSIQVADYDEEWVTFTLGGENVQHFLFTFWRYLQRHCPPKIKYKGVRCGSTSSLPTCPKTLEGCRERNNSHRFGGEPGMLTGGLYAT